MVTQQPAQIRESCIARVQCQAVETICVIPLSALNL